MNKIREINVGGIIFPTHEKYSNTLFLNPVAYLKSETLKNIQVKFKLNVQRKKDIGFRSKRIETWQVL